MDVKKEDRILTSGMSLKSLNERTRYPNPNFILNQLPPHERLVLGGFHHWDCVDKVARESYKRGIDTFVDEDTTNHFFGRVSFGSIPLIRKDWTLKELGIPDKLYEYAVEERSDKPWLVQA